MNEEEVDAIAWGIALDHIMDGPEWLSIVETVQEEYEDSEDEDWNRVSDQVFKYLAEANRLISEKENN